MHTIKAILMAFVACALVVGCGGKDDGKLNTEALAKSFTGADAAVKPFVDRAIAAAGKEDYGTVVVELSRIANDAKLTPAQQQALKDVLAKAQKIVAASPPKNVEQLPMALPK